MSIIVSKNGKDAKKLDKLPFGLEDTLQQYIYDNPESIPLSDIKDDIHLLILAREFETKSGPIDAIGTDCNGEIYLVETKLYKNPEKRLVVAQVLDYGAALWKSNAGFEEFLHHLNDHSQKQFGQLATEKIQAYFNLDDDSLQGHLDTMKSNLSEGKFKFVVLMDTMQDQLKDLILFINQNSKFDLYGVELEYYQYDSFEIMIPRLFGAEVKKDIAASTSKSVRSSWDEQSFFTACAKNLDDQQLQAVRQLYEYSKNNADAITWGTGGLTGSFNPKFLCISKRSLFTVNSFGSLLLNFGWLNDTQAAEKYRDMLKTLIENEKLLVIPPDYRTHYPERLVGEWSVKVERLIAIIDHLVRDARATSQAGSES